MKYYYTDPLKAAWMATEFKIPILVTNWRYSEDNGHSPYEFTTNIIEIIDSDIKCYEIHPDCYEILKLKIGDIILDNDNDPRRVAVVRDIAMLRYEDEDYGCYIKDIKIIQRDGKAFFQPEEEKE